MNKIVAKAKSFYCRYRPEVFGFLVPFTIESVLLLIGYIVVRYGLSSCDCFAQYMPFFTEFYDKLTSGESLFFSWSGAMGYDFWSVFSYYLASPLNWIILLFGRKGIAFSVNLLILLKTSLCGATFVHFLRVKYGRGGFKLPVLFGTMFALSGYTLGYCFNVMWFDSIVLFPLILLALERMLYEKKLAKYCLLLALSLIFNYFIGFMTCIFIFLYFFTCKFNGFKDFFAKLIRIAISSIIAVGAAAIILLPSYMVLKSTSISTETIPGFKLIGSWGDTLYNILFCANPIAISWTSNKANMFISGFGLLMAFVYLASGAFSKKDKICNMALILFMYFSYNCEFLNYIWHGFHKQNGIPNRFSFMVIFLILSMGYQAAKNRRSTKSCEIILAVVFHLAFLTLIYHYKKHMVDYCVLTGVIAVIYAFLALRYRSSRKTAKLVFIPIMAELTIMFAISFFNVTGMSLDGYFEYTDDMLKAGKLTEDMSQNDFYREKLDQSNNLREYIVNDDYDYVSLKDLNVSTALQMIANTRNIGHHSVLNEESLYSMNAGSLFNTFTSSAMSEFVKKTGGSGSSNTIIYRGENSFMDMLLGVKYYYSRYHTTSCMSYNYVDTIGSVDIYENKHALSVGYSVPEKFAELSDYYKSNPFRTMNEMATAICGKPAFKTCEFDYIDCSDAELTENSPTYAKFKDVAFKGTATYSYTADSDQNFLFYLVCGDMYLTEVRINDELITTDRKSRQVYDLGMLSKGDTVELTIIMKKKAELTMNIYGAVLENSIIDECYDILSEEQLDVSYWDDNTIKGTVKITADKSSFLLTVPYSKGWSVTVDGKKVEPSIFSETFILLELSAGEHEIELNYITPGFLSGAACSAVCFSIIGGMFLISKRRKFSAI